MIRCDKVKELELIPPLPYKLVLQAVISTTAQFASLTFLSALFKSKYHNDLTKGNACLIAK